MPSLRVSVNGDDTSIEMEMPRGSKVSHLRSALLEDQGNTRKNVRVIVQGKVLDDERILSSPSILACGLVQCAITTPSPSVEEGSRESRSSTRISIGNTSNNARSGRGRLEWIGGFLIGLLVGFIMIIVSMDKSIGMSERWRSGLACGVAVNIIFGVLLLTKSGF